MDLQIPPLALLVLVVVGLGVVGTIRKRRRPARLTRRAEPSWMPDEVAGVPGRADASPIPNPDAFYTRLVPPPPVSRDAPDPAPVEPLLRTSRQPSRAGDGRTDSEEDELTGQGAVAGGPLEPHDPRRLGAYRVLARLGQGGFGSVYLGVDDAGRRVAIKVIRPELLADHGFRERFRREAANAQRVARHSTAEVLDFDDAGPQPYLVTEYIEGPTLYSWVRSNGPMRGSTAEQLATAVASALAAIHRAGIVHRDLKPSNVLLSPTGPRVIDFGIARAVDASDVFSRGTTQMGTLGYMAPEQIRGQAVTPKTDVFAWGALVAFAGTAIAPFGTGDPATVMYRTLDTEPELDRLDAPLRRLTQHALAKDPDSRPNVADLLTTLNHARLHRASPR